MIVPQPRVDRGEVGISLKSNSFNVRIILSDTGHCLTSTGERCGVATIVLIKEVLQFGVVRAVRPVA